MFLSIILGFLMGLLQLLVFMKYRRFWGLVIDALGYGGGESNNNKIGIIFK